MRCVQGTVSIISILRCLLQELELNDVQEFDNMSYNAGSFKVDILLD